MITPIRKSPEGPHHGSMMPMASDDHEILQEHLLDGRNQEPSPVVPPHVFNGNVKKKPILTILISTIKPTYCGYRPTLLTMGHLVYMCIYIYVCVCTCQMIIYAAYMYTYF